MHLLWHTWSSANLGILILRSKIWIKQSNRVGLQTPLVQLEFERESKEKTMLLGMSQTNFCFTLPILGSAKSRGNCSNRKTLNPRASLSNPNFPLASRIMVRNLGYSINESSLQKEFLTFGEIAEVKLVKDEARKRSTPYAFIQYTCQDDAILALESMDQKVFDGRLIYVEIAKPQKGSFGAYPIASGPPKKYQHLQHLEQDEVADCWY